MSKEIWIVGGPNGAGKTTWVRAALEAQKGVPYLSADQIADELSPGKPEEAAISAGCRRDGRPRRGAARPLPGPRGLTP